MGINYQDIGEKIFSDKEFIENSLLGIGILQEGRVIYVNNTILKVFGYSFDEIQEKDFLNKIIHPEDLPLVNKQIEGKLKEKKFTITRYKCRILLKSGATKWIEVFSKAFYYEEKLAILFTIIEIPKPKPLIELSTNDLAKLSVVEQLLKNFNISYRLFNMEDSQKDLDGKKEYIEEIKKSYERFERIINNVLDVIAEINSDGTFAYVNTQSIDLFGYHPKDLIGKNAFSYVHPEDLPLLRKKMVEAISKDQIFSIEYRIYHKDGFYIPVSTRGGVYREKGEIKFIGIVRNNSAQKELEGKLLNLKLESEDLQDMFEEKLHENAIKLKEYEGKFNHLLETSPYSVILMSFKGMIIECNSATVDLFNYEKDEFIGKNLLEFISFPSKSLILLENTYKQLIKGHKLNPIEIQCYTKEGKLIEVKVSSSLVKLHNEILIQVIIQDISKVKLVGFKDLRFSR